ncbi:MAG: hypothetical protein JOZ92_06400 [Candidatus Dormibacteraeota bacterium]|nr:hypothetical protein [Candidatus Dormibacteraeota bacterium]
MAVFIASPAHAGSTAARAAIDTPTRGQLLYATNFDPSTFNQQVVGTSASLTEGPGPSLVCGVGSAGSKMIASVANWSVAEPTSIWAEDDINLDSMNGQYVASFYFEGIGGNHRHLHIDFSADQIVLRNPSYQDEGPVASIPGLSSGSTFDIVVIDTSPHYQVYVNGTLVIDYTDNLPASTPNGFGFDCASQANGTGSDSLTDFSLYSVNGACAAGWTCGDIGSPTPAGSSSLNGSTWTVQGGGSDIQGTADHFQFASQALSGDGSVSAHVTAQSNTSSWAKAGVMLRATTDPGSPYYAVFATPGNGIDVQYRSAQGGSTGTSHSGTTTLPIYLQITRTGTSFSAFTSSNGSTYTLVPGSTKTVAALSGTLLGGIAVSSHNASSLSTVTMDTVSVTPATSPPPPTCPTGWTCADIGSPAAAGTQSLSGSTWTIQGGGTDLQGASDQFHFVWQTMNANGTVSADVTAQSNSSVWAKAGVMLRLSSDPGAPYYAVFITPGNGVDVQYRSAQGGSTSSSHTGSGTAAVPLYLEIVRSGTSFTAYTSPDGAAWTAVTGSTHTVSALSGALLEGLAVCSHSASALSTVTMSAVVTS